MPLLTHVPEVGLSKIALTFDAPTALAALINHLNRPEPYAVDLELIDRNNTYRAETRLYLIKTRNGEPVILPATYIKQVAPEFNSTDLFVFIRAYNQMLACVSANGPQLPIVTPYLIFGAGEQAKAPNFDPVAFLNGLATHSNIAELTQELNERSTHIYVLEEARAFLPLVQIFAGKALVGVADTIEGALQNAQLDTWLMGGLEQ